ncbi:hypothetical protein IQ254_09320 [Nodosilinea sp. LEGE 07088]|uniref:hypothetical protein n=1 Tax=Nodosilinea sp. LEGE 07088 TaxID=2777968 RepID=UPI0018818AAE|nr:hypothetical protein [Nodosilinea sp. LEGE 07088]MBE9137406.1 hypothetical protein [Nodosilinea sp. LEGE 07088]
MDLRSTGGRSTTPRHSYAGRPTLVMPYSHDQPDNAARAKRLGTLLTIHRDRYAAAPVAKVLQKLLVNSSYAAKAEAIGRIIQAENGVTAACDAIEAQLQTASVSL